MSEGTIAEVLAGAATWSVTCADCLDVLPTLPERCVDHVITDPPYEAEAHTLQRRVKRGKVVAVEPLDFAPITEPDRQAAGLSMCPILRRWALIFCQIEAVHLWRSVLETGAARYMRTCLWDKPDGQPQLTGDRPAQGYEAILAMHAPGKSRWWGGGRRGVFRHSARWSGGTAHDHPTEKPLLLMAELVELFTDPAECILDPFAGSGTMGVAALRLGRRVILIEREQKWADLCRERLLAEEQSSTLQARRAGQEPLFR